MKILHLSDLHIGKRLNGFSLLDDQIYIHQQILQLAKKEQVEAVIIAGDVFDKSVPSSEAVQIFDEFLNSWAELNLPIFIISGNHDNATRLCFGHKIFKHSNIYIAPMYTGKITHITLHDEFGNLNFYLLPFIKPSSIRTFFPEEEINSYNKAIELVLKKNQLNSNERNILIAHQFVTGAITSDSEEINVGGIDNVDATLFSDFDYVALGHIHTSQTILRDTIRYCGTALKYSFSEVNHKKTITIIDFKNKNNINVSSLLLKPLHDMRKLIGTYEELTCKDNYINTDTDDYLAITLTDEEEIPDAINRLRSIYPNIMQLTYDNTRTRTQQTITTVDINHLKTPFDLFNEFYTLQNNKPLNEMQTQIIAELIADTWEEK